MKRFVLKNNDCLSFAPSEISLNEVNFIYGKNGVGKTTISHLLEDQFSSEYDVRVFNGFQGLISRDDELNAISLGRQNVDAQIVIDELNVDIKKIDDEITDMPGVDNLFRRCNQIKKSLEEEGKSRDRLYAKAAREIKNISNPQISATTYNRQNFENELGNAKRISDYEINEAKDECRAELITNLRKIVLPACDFKDVLHKANALLMASVSSIVFAPGIGDDPDKRQFAELGMHLHDREEGEVCAFCGGVITAERWSLLDKIFDSSVTLLKHKLDELISDLENQQKIFLSLKRVGDDNCYPPFKTEALELSAECDAEKQEAIRFINEILDLLTEKRKNLFFR